MGMTDYLLILSSYLSGSIPFGLIVYYLLKGNDIRKYGSKNIGATNVLRNAGAIPGVTVFVLDVLKGFLPVFIAGFFGVSSETWTITIIAVAAVVGHMFPVWLRFKGGKGVATAVGVFLALSWSLALFALALFITSVLITRIVSLSSLVAAGFFALLSFTIGPWLNMSLELQIASLVVSSLIFVKHHENIKRLIQGTEKKITSKK